MKINIYKLRFSCSLFLVFFLSLLLISGIHMGFIVLVNEYRWHTAVQILIPVAYWALIAAAMLILTNKSIKNSFEKPVQKLAEATAKVANGDFSVYVPPVHTLEYHNYIDKMILDFNKMVEELGSIETLKTDFFSNVSHEIKTPLAVIQNSAELLRKEPLTQEQAEYADAIYQTSKRLSGLITNILKLNKIEKQTILPDKQTYDLCVQLTECALRFESIWEQRSIEFEADIEDSVYITADRELMDIVWSNLLSNAFKFTEPSGTVRMIQHRTEKEISVTVSDSGCGMSRETQKHIFDKFYQGDTSHSAEGNGLGLALTQRILTLMDHSVSVKSELGKGTEFTVHIPIESVANNDE